MVKANIEEDPKPGMPFNMIEGMMPMYPLIAIMGWMIVLIVLVLSAMFISPAIADYLSSAKGVREATFSDANALAHLAEAWLPHFKFLGLGFGLMAIAMALGTIAKRLRRMGKVVTYYMPESVRPAIPPIPKAVRMFQLSTVMGVMILMMTFLLGAYFTVVDVSTYFVGSSQAALNAEAVPTLLGSVSSFKAWLNPLQMIGMAFLMVGITIALIVIIGTLNTQNKILREFKQKS